MKLEIQPTVSDFIKPSKGSTFAAGLDIFAQQDIVITGETQLIDLGFKAAIEDGWVAVLLPRSGSGAKYNVQLSNTAGVIDSDYRGSWMAALHLGGKGTKVQELPADAYGVTQLVIPRGEAICQMVILPVPEVEMSVVDQLRETVRGDGGFGSTDKKQ